MEADMEKADSESNAAESPESSKLNGRDSLATVSSLEIDAIRKIAEAIVAPQWPKPSSLSLAAVPNPAALFGSRCY
jgi:hypothetical protein